MAAINKPANASTNTFFFNIHWSFFEAGPNDGTAGFWLETRVGAKTVKCVESEPV